MSRNALKEAMGIFVLTAALIGVVEWLRYQSEHAAIDRVRAGFAATLRCQESGGEYDAKTRHCQYRPRPVSMCPDDSRDDCWALPGSDAKDLPR